MNQFEGRLLKKLLRWASACAVLLLPLSLASNRAYADTVIVTVPGTADPWLAGMPPGSTASITDVAPAQSPVQILGLPIIPGLTLTFQATGLVTDRPAAPFFGPDGDDSRLRLHLTGAENGIANVIAPIDALMGVFLGPDQPNLTPAPGALDFGTPASRDYLTLFPALKQVFFIGDGLTSGGVQQQVIVPAGATRLFLGPMDAVEWSNNVGSFTVQVSAVIPEPPSFCSVSARRS